MVLELVPMMAILVDHLSFFILFAGFLLAF
jgi:hypothetical protein